MRQEDFIEDLVEGVVESGINGKEAEECLSREHIPSELVTSRRMDMGHQMMMERTKKTVNNLVQDCIMVANFRFTTNITAALKHEDTKVRM